MRLCSLQWTCPWPGSSSTSTVNTPTCKTSKSSRVRPRTVTPGATSHNRHSNVFHLPLHPDIFTRHQVQKPIPVESLTKCRMQDNLEFLQWVKKYWDQHYPGGDYDAVGRRRASGAPVAAAAAAPRAASSGSRRGVTPTTAASRGPRVAAAAVGGGAATAALQQEIATQKEAIAGLEKERDFYFAKLRDIELLLQNAIEENPELENEEDTLVKHIQGILYSTEVS